MLEIKTGRFHPDLERTLVDDLRRLREHDRTGPAAIVVPSAPLLSRVRELLVLDARLPLLNVHLLTFHQLNLRLQQERLTACGASAGGPVAVMGDFYFRSLLGQVVKRQLPVGTPLEALGSSRGGRAALWATIRDLRDAAVEPAVVARALTEAVFEPEDRAGLEAVLTIYASMIEGSRALSVTDIDGLSRVVTPWVGESRFLQSLRGLWYYGFYDLTQVQLSLLQAVTRSVPVTVLFPLEEDGAYAFGRRFLDRHLLPLLPPSERVTSVRTAAVDRQERPLQIQVHSAVGPEDELTVVAKDILRLVESHAYRFDEIGVVARMLDPYHPFLRRVFDQHRIPFTSTAVVPALTYPAVKVFLQAAFLPLSHLSRSAVLDLVASPFYRLDRLRDGASGPPDVLPRPDLWRIAVGELGIRRGEADWARLHTIDAFEAQVDGGSDEGEDRAVSIPVAQLRLLGRLVGALIDDCHALPQQGSMAELTDAFVAFVADHLTLPGLANGDRDPEPIADALAQILVQLRQVDEVFGTVSWRQWAGALEELLQEAVLPIESMDQTAGGGHRGVQVLDAMAARGIPFRALFLVGLNEKVFPRYIREDPFLRDRPRRVLDATLGYKIDEKLAGYDEEQLLFALLRRAAGQRLYLSYQRADTDGRPLTPSPYLTGIEPVLHFPQRFSDRSGWPQFSRLLLTREELALHLILDAHDPSPVLTAMGHDPGIFRNGLGALQAIEGSSQELGAYDGLVGPLPEQRTRLMEQGLAPTSLEAYARCPARYFATHVLGLQPVRQPLIDGLPPHVWGRLVHEALRACYERLVKENWPACAIDLVTRRRYAASAVDRAFSHYALQRGSGHLLLWEMAKETVTALVTAMLDQDDADYRADGYRPLAFEIEAEGEIPAVGPDRQPLKVHGRLDRVDVGPAGGLRVIDYKLKLGKRMSPIDRDLVLSAIRGLRLQPPLYAWLRVTDGPTPERVEFRFLAPLWERVLDRSTFEAALWRSPTGTRINATLQVLLGGLDSGAFVMLPADYCDFCDVATACRRYHGPSWWRAYRSPAARELRALRTLKAAAVSGVPRAPNEA